ncbi:MAG TPA: NUDIX hydrolase [Candidatus Limnocylindrales bacterium]|nr:NUDIX hydrolase [Candidatus Limnocylindrales bacterium]
MAARFCVQCGTKLVRRSVEHRFRNVCLKCGHIAFRNAKPAVGLLIERDDRLLLVRRARAPFEGYWDIPGGFLEAEESPEKGAVREAREETGLRVKVDELLGAYHGTSGDDYTLNLYYTAHVIGGREKAGDDASAMRWFAVAEVPTRIAFPGHTRHVIRDWLRGRTGTR